MLILNEYLTDDAKVFREFDGGEGVEVRGHSEGDVRADGTHSLLRRSTSGLS